MAENNHKIKGAGGYLTVYKRTMSR